MKKLCLVYVLFLMTGAATIYAQQNTSRTQENIERTKERLGDKLLTTADQVIARHVEAVGGRNAILSVKTMTFKGRQASFGAEDRHLYRYYEQPNLVRSSWSPEGESYTVSDGETVWLVTPEGRKEQTAWWAKSFSHSRIDGNFIDYEKRGIAYEYVGLKGFETDLNVYYHVRRTFPDGFIEELYFDVGTGLLHGVWPTSSPRKNDPCFYYDYRDVGGILITHMWARVFDEVAPPHVLVVEEIRVNEKLDEGFFTEYLKKPILN